MTNVNCLCGHKNNNHKRIYCHTSDQRFKDFSFSQGSHCLGKCKNCECDRWIPQLKSVIPNVYELRKPFIKNTIHNDWKKFKEKIDNEIR